MTKVVEGVVTTFINKDAKSHAGILLDGSDKPWYNKKEPIPEGLGKGAKVKLKIDESEQFYNIADVTILEEADNKDRGNSSRESAQSKGSTSKKSPGGESNSSSTSSFQSRKSRDITVKVATKLAVEKASTSPGENQGAHLDEVNELANGYKNIMQGLLKEINEGEQ